MVRSTRSVRLRTMLRIAGRTIELRCRHPSRRLLRKLLRMRTVLTPSLQRLFDRDLQYAVEIGRRHRPDQLVDDGAVAADHEGFGHAIDAPFDRTAAVAVDADDAERIAVAAEEAAGVIGRILVVDADDLQPRVFGQRGQQRRLVVAWHAPGSPDVDDGDPAL